MHWRYVHLSVRGSSHISSGLPCQDSSLAAVLVGVDGGDVLVLLASDGAGSALRSDRGANLACTVILEEMQLHLSEGRCLSDITVDDTRVWINKVLNVVSQEAEREELPFREFACTLLGAIIDSTVSVFFQIGDGAIVIGDEESYQPIFWPQSGEYVNTTYFVTDDLALERLQFLTIDRGIDEVAIFTDGVQSLALQYDTQTAHAPFFRPVFEHLRVERPGVSCLLRRKLAAFLDSPRVSAKTDDDKTVVLATRRAACNHRDRQF